MLDDLPKISQLDKGNILSSIEHLPEQIQDAWNEIQKVELPQEYGDCQNIVVAGMGGSALGGRIVHYLEFKNLRVPVEVVTNYHLPSYVNNKTLVILSSYSGNTEETISCAADGVNKNAKIFGIETGGKLLEILEEHKLPFYKIDPANNPSGQPRMGLGYSISSILAILSKLKFIDIEDDEILNAIEITEKFVKEFGVRSHTENNIAKKLADKLANKIPVLISSEHLVGSTHAFKNQLNENSKNFSMHFEISELNHHLMEGLKYPAKAKEILHFVFFESNNYFERIQKRYSITQDVVKQNGYGFDIYKMQSKHKLEEVFELLALGSYISFYIAMIHGIDPSPIPWVDYFKKKME
ncbi:MAG TPA: bifunctional phosphoglucose/phosphomannose isomerase [Patescibacteria group bacterium]|nr:bifunctional phosphoglucose/phosphomannose isomerase [Patescibacteria group bacterium]